MSNQGKKGEDVLISCLKRERAKELKPREYRKDEKRRKLQPLDPPLDDEESGHNYPENDNNDGYENNNHASSNHNNNHASRTPDDDFASDNEMVEETEEDDTIDDVAPTLDLRRSGRLSDKALLSEPVVVVPKKKKKPDDVIHPVWGRADVSQAVDGAHKLLLEDFNEKVNTLQKLQLYLSKNPDEMRDAFVYLCEDEIILSREEEWEYLQTCDAYQNHEYEYVPIPEDFLAVHRRKVIKGAAVVIGKDENGQWPCTDLVAKWIVDALRVEEDQWFPHDADYPVQGDLPLQPGQCTVKTLLRELSGVWAKNNTPHSHTLDILNVLDRNIPGLRLGIRKSKTEKNIHDIKKYLVKDYRDVRIDVCPNNCILFIGDHAEAIRCPCGEYRFSKCGNNGKCKKGGVNCSPFLTPTHNQRSSFQEIHYRLVRSHHVCLISLSPFLFQTPYHQTILDVQRVAVRIQSFRIRRRTVQDAISHE
jgi:hypothetical protein